MSNLVKVKMVADDTGCPDGVTSTKYPKDSIATIPADLAAIFVRRSTGEIVADGADVGPKEAGGNKGAAAPTEKKDVTLPSGKVIDLNAIDKLPKTEFNEVVKELDIKTKGKKPADIIAEIMALFAE